jgi:CDP-6-deoxy-D-xylo-4-hexulose-3-dehydrase
MWKLGRLPYGYDHKYIYSEIGFNLKMTDLQAAIGCAQIQKIDKFVKKRKENFNYLKKRFIEEGLDKYFILPQQTQNSDPSWFGFPLTIKNKNIKKQKLLEDLTKQGVENRPIFAGNITKQPYFIDYKIKYRLAEKLINTDKVMKQSFWIGVYPALNKDDMEKVFNIIKNVLKENLNKH